MNYVIPQSKLNEIVARWINAKVDRVQEGTDSVGLPYYDVYQKNGKKLISIFFLSKDLSLLIYHDEIIYRIYDFIPFSIDFSFLGEAIVEYVKNLLRSFEMEELDPYLKDNTKVIFRLLPIQD